MTRALPPSASVALPDTGARLVSPSAVRNTAPLCDLLRRYAPTTGSALEIASGTGEHVTAFAAALPGLHWQPSDIEESRRTSIDAHVAHSGLTNVAPAVLLNAATSDWGLNQPPRDLIVVVNLLHLIATTEVLRVIAGVAIALKPGGTLIIYGPFRRNGALTSEGDIRFDAELRAADPDIGYKDDLDMVRWLGDDGLILTDTVPMPANNIAFIARKASS